MTKPTLTASETAACRKWNSRAPLIPGNTIPAWDHIKSIMPDSVVADTYEDAFGKGTAKARTRDEQVAAISALQACIAAAEQRGRRSL